MTVPVMEQGSLLDLLAADPLHARDREAVTEAIRAEAQANGGIVDQNSARRRFPSWVSPQAVGPTYSALRKAGLLVVDGWNMSTDAKGRNAGKHQRRYRWAGEL